MNYSLPYCNVLDKPHPLRRGAHSAHPDVGPDMKKQHYWKKNKTKLLTATGLIATYFRKGTRKRCFICSAWLSGGGPDRIDLWKCWPVFPWNIWLKSKFYIIVHWLKNAFLMNPFQCPQWGRGVKHFDWAEQQNAVILRLSLEFIDLIDKQSDDFHLIISNPDRVFPQGIGQISIVWLQPIKK